MGPQIIGQTRACIADFQRDPGLAQGVVARLYPDTQPVPAAGMAQRVVDEVGDDLAHAVRIGSDIGAAITILHGQLYRQGHLALLQLGAQFVHHISNQRGQINAFFAQRQLARIGHGQGVQIAHQSAQMLNLGQQRLHFCLIALDHAIANGMQACLQHR